MPRLRGEEVYTPGYRATASTEALWIPGPALSRVMLIVSIHLSRCTRIVAGGWSIAITMPRRLPLSARVSFGLMSRPQEGTQQ